MSSRPPADAGGTDLGRKVELMRAIFTYVILIHLLGVTVHKKSPLNARRVDRSRHRPTESQLVKVTGDTATRGSSRSISMPPVRTISRAARRSRRTTTRRKRASPITTIPHGRKSRQPDLSKRRGNGRLVFNWYRINITIPERSVISTRPARPSSLKPRSMITPRSGSMVRSRAFLGSEAALLSPDGTRQTDSS